MLKYLNALTHEFIEKCIPESRSTKYISTAIWLFQIGVLFLIIHVWL